MKKKVKVSEVLALISASFFVLVGLVGVFVIPFALNDYSKQSIVIKDWITAYSGPITVFALGLTYIIYWYQKRSSRGLDEKIRELELALDKLNSMNRELLNRSIQKSNRK